MLQTRPQPKPRRRPSTTHADSRFRSKDPFRRYRTEKEQAVRQAQLKLKDLPTDLREKREMLRAMTPKQVLAVIEFYDDLTFFEALELAKSTGRLIVPNDVHDRILTGIDDEQSIKQVYPTRTGTILIYEKPDKSFGRFVGFEGIVFEVPEQFQGKTNCALVVEHPDFEIINVSEDAAGSNTDFDLKTIRARSYELIVKDPSRIHLIENFPRKDRGWYMPHTKTIISQDAEVTELAEARHLWRLSNGSYIGSMGRDGGDWRRAVFAVYGHNAAFGVALF